MFPVRSNPNRVRGNLPHNILVFLAAAIPEADGTLKLYWGGADTVMCAGQAKVDDLIEMCK